MLVLGHSFVVFRGEFFISVGIPTYLGQLTFFMWCVLEFEQIDAKYVQLFFWNWYYHDF